MTRRKIKIPVEIQQHSAHVKRRSRDKAKAQQRLRMAAMINASEPMRRFAERYPRPVIGMALNVAWMISRPFSPIPDMEQDDVIHLAEALAWLDQDRKHCVRVEKVIQLIQRYGPELITSVLSNRGMLEWLEGKLL